MFLSCCTSKKTFGTLSHIYCPVSVTAVQTESANTRIQTQTHTERERERENRQKVGFSYRKSLKNGKNPVNWQAKICLKKWFLCCRLKILSLKKTKSRKSIKAKGFFSHCFCPILERVDFYSALYFCHQLTAFHHKLFVSFLTTVGRNKKLTFSSCILPKRVKKQQC